MLSNWRTVAVWLLASAGLLVLAPAATSASPPGVVCTLKPGRATLAPDARRGLAHHLRQYPDLSAASRTQRRAALRLLARVRAAAMRWRDVRRAAASGFDTHTGKRGAADAAVGYLHAEHRRFSDDGRILDPRATRVAHLRDPAGAAARAGRRDVQRPARRARADAGRRDRPLALPPRLRQGRQARASRRSPTAPALAEPPARRGARCCTSGSPATSGARSRCTPRCPSSVATACSAPARAAPGPGARRCDSDALSRSAPPGVVSGSEVVVTAACLPDRHTQASGPRGREKTGALCSPFAVRAG